MDTAWSRSQYNECQAPQLSRRERVEWGAFDNNEGVMKKAQNMQLLAHFNSTAALQAWTVRKQGKLAVTVIHRRRARIPPTHVQKGIIRTFELCQHRKIREAVVYAMESNIT
uniref:Uncharacterized protein n=1 Tax=Haemonchus contortus TaxID=6289 RepID=A0A7I4YSA0_HAECO